MPLLFGIAFEIKEADFGLAGHTTAMAHRMLTCTYGPYEYVINENQPVARMFLICDGRVEMEDWQGDQLVEQWTLRKSQIFGSEFLMFRSEAYVSATQFD